MIDQRALLPLREKVAAKPTDEGLKVVSAADADTTGQF
jgi:hypothetical protein